MTPRATNLLDSAGVTTWTAAYDRHQTYDPTGPSQALGESGVRSMSRPPPRVLRTFRSPPDRGSSPRARTASAASRAGPRGAPRRYPLARVAAARVRVPAAGGMK